MTLATMAVPLLLLSAPPATAMPPKTAPPTGPDPTFLRTFAETRAFTLGYPSHVTPSPDGKTVLFLRSPARVPSLGLYEFDVATGMTRELVTPDQILQGAAEVLSVEEKARRERMRITTRGFTTFQLAEDGARILLPLSGRLWIYERATGKVNAVTDGKAPTLAPQLSRDATEIAYVKAHDVHVVSTKGGAERAITRGGTAEVTHGQAEFVAEEEMGRHAGLWWSPDGKSIVFEEADHQGLERFAIADPARPERAPDVFPYPRPGKANVKVRLGIARVGARALPPVWIKWDAARYPYLARVVWKEAKAPLCILVQSRDQREEVLLRVDPRTGRTAALLVEKDDAWVGLDESPRWLPDGSGFLWATDRAGPRALELHRPDGKLDRVLVAEGFLGIAHVAADSKSIVAHTGTPVESTVMRVGLDGSPAQALTDQAGEHGAVFAKNGSIFVVTHTATGELPSTVVRRADGTRVADLPNVAEEPPFSPHVWIRKVRGASGRTYFAATVQPRSFDPKKKYPVIVDVYGGPGSLKVRNDLRSYLLDQWIADNGAVVVAIDNRGTPRRDRDWRVAIKNDFSGVTLDDQVDALQALGKQMPYLDLARVGIVGWSFGGYLAALAVMKRPDVFKAAVAGAPVVDWKDYDTHYTERYLDLPDKNPKGYDESSLLTHAPKLTRPLLIIHGTADDNVYFFHSLKLSDALLRAGKPHDVMPLAGFTHQIPDPVVRERLSQRIATFLLGHI